MITDVSFDPAGNAWIAHHWYETGVAEDASLPNSAWGGGPTEISDPSNNSVP